MKKENFLKELLRSLEAIKNNPKSIEAFEEVIGTSFDFDLIKSAILAKFISIEAINTIQRLAPICYKIGDLLFLRGDDSRKVNYVGDDEEGSSAVELYNMSEEMKTGDSYTFYVSTCEWFPLASADEINAVKKFLDNLK